MDLEPYSAWIRLGKQNIQTELYPPIMNYIPDLPNKVLPATPVDIKTEYWFLQEDLSLIHI